MTTKYNISAKFGQKEIVNADINSYFSNSNVNSEWTENMIYRNAKICDVTTTISDSQKKGDLIKSSDSNFGKIFPIIDEGTFADYFDRKSSFESHLMKKKDIIQSQKNEFFSGILKVDNIILEKQEVNKQIKEKFYELVKNDENLRKILKVNNNLSNLNIPGSSISKIISPISTDPQLKSQTTYNPYQNPNQLNQPQQQTGYYNYNQAGGFSNYSYK